MKMDRRCYRSMLTHLCADQSREQGGMLGMKDGVLCYFHPDTHALSTKTRYVPCTSELDKKRREWSRDGITFCGIVHSHLAADSRLSDGDRHYVQIILEALGFHRLYFPVAAITPDHIDLCFYAARLRQGELQIEEEPLTLI